MVTSLKDKSVLVTGGVGAFGQKFLRFAKDQGVREVVLFSRDEMKHAALKRELGPSANGWVRFVIGDITQADSLRLALRGVDVVIHAAAMKHLPECEQNVAASVRVNVFGTQTVVSEFLLSEASTLIFLSTDKAPYASSVYGAQKYMAEKLVTEANRVGGPGKRAYTLRYSNVMDSTGSVFHIFRQLLQSDKTATVNGRGTSRGFVSQSQALACIEASLTVAQGGEVFVLVPEVVSIAELAEAMRELVGRGSVQVNEGPGFVGEKESATLVMAEEASTAKAFPELKGAKGLFLDLLGRHAGRAAATDVSSGLSLEQCPKMGGSQLREFLRRLM